MNSPARGNRYFLLLLMYELSLSLLASYLFYEIDIEINMTVWLAASQLLVFLPPVVVYLLITRQKIQQVLPLSELNLINLGLIVLISITVQPLMMFLAALSSLFSENEVSIVVSDLNNGPFFVTLIVIGLMPAVCEEITMRGIVLSNYHQVNIKKAALINGLFFGILHFSANQFLYAAVMGVIFVYLVRYTRSIYASIISHFVINGSQCLLSLWALNITEANPELVEPEITFAYKVSLIGNMGIVALIFFPVFAYLFHNFIQYNKRRNIGILLTEKVMIQLDQNPYVRPKIFNRSFWCILVFYVAAMALMRFSQQ